MRALSPFPLLVAVYALAGCGSNPEPIDYSRYLRVGVDVSEEANAVIETLGEAGWVLDRRIDGTGFAALLFSRHGLSAARLVTERGVAIAWGGNGEVERFHIVGVDGTRRGQVQSREVILGERDAEIPRTCLTRVRVAPGGAPVVTPVIPIPEDPDACVEAFDNVIGDEETEAIVVIRERRLARGAIPSVPVPLVLEDERFRVPGPDLLAGYCEGLEAQRAEELAVARSAGDAEEAFRVGVERAMLGRVCGASEGDQLSRITEAVDGLSVNESLRRAVETARALVRNRFSREPAAEPEAQ